jgi:catecholate siderophore receptor
MLSSSLLILLACAAQAQPISSTIRGRILDPARAPIGGARITAHDEVSSREFAVLSMQSGEFQIAAPPGTYCLKIAAEGFQEYVRTVELAASTASTVDYVLQLEVHKEALMVTEAAGSLQSSVSSGTKTLTPLINVPQSIVVVNHDQIADQLMMSIGDVVRYVPGVTAHQGENNRDQVVIRGNSSSADFFVNGVRDDVQYYRDLYNLDRVEVLKGPNAVIFGRGGAGGVVNRVTKEAGLTPLHEISLQAGSYGNKRVAMDFDQPLGSKAALRFNGVLEDSGSFRQNVNLRRYGIAPALTLIPDARTRITLGYEYFQDRRTADRGIPSFQGRPVDVPVETFYGNPADSRVNANVHLGTAAVERQFGRLNIRNRTQVGGYDRGYQNYVPGAVNALRTAFSLSAYNNATGRLNLFNQTDATYSASTGAIRHTLLAGVELGRQLTDNFRNTGYFNGSAAAINVSYDAPAISTPATFRQSATDANNHLRTNLGAVYLQDQVELSRFVQLVGGIRFDHFDLQYHNNRTDDKLRRIDNVISPRAGLIVKPARNVSAYGNYSVSFLPSSGDQFSSLTTITQQVKPEKFTNLEAGVKWDIRPSLSFTTAIYRLNRTNTRATDPNDPTRIVQTGSQRTNGMETGITGSITRKWKVAGGYAFQDAFITSQTTAARVGAQVAQVPHHTFSMWNNYQVLPRLGAGVGVIRRTDMFASIDNSVTLPGYTRADAAVYFHLTEKLRLQANVENLFGIRYYMNADNNTNISPGSPRQIRVALITRF